MIATLRGTLEAIQDDRIIVSVSGIGFEVRVPASLLDRIDPVGSPIELYTHMHVRENEISLYGCATADELAVFRQLLGVRGVGPRIALNVLSVASPDTLRAAIAEGNAQALTRIPGIGTRTAQQIIVDLRGKIDLAAVAAGVPALSPADAEVIAALTTLGYSVAEAQAALRSLPAEDMDVEEKIIRALRYFGQER